MLDAIRKRSSGIIVKGLLGLLILSFAMWGVADVVSPGGGEQDIATVGSMKIDDELVRREYRREIERLSGILGKRLDPEQARAFGIPESVVAGIVNRTLYDVAATDMGIIIDDALVRDNIRTMAVFKTDKGEFQRNLFQQVLQSNGLSEAAFVEQIRNGLRRSQYLSLLAQPPAAPAAMAKALSSFRGEKRIVESVSIGLDSIKIPDKPTQADLEKFHKDNATRYSAPEYRKLTMVRLQASELAREVAVSEDEIARLYESRADEFAVPESRTLRQIRVADEATAKKVHERLSAGEDFTKVAKDIAGMDSKATQLGKMTRNQLPPELGDAAFTLQVGAITPAIKSPLGWHVIKLTAIEAASQKTLAQVKDALKKDIATEKAIESLYQLANTLEDQLGGGSGLEDAARALGITPIVIDAIDANGLDEDGKKVTDLPVGDFLTVAFTTPEGTDSQLGEDGDDGYYVVRIDQITPPAIRPIAKVLKQVTEAWTQSRRAEIAKKSADDILEKLKTGGDLFKLASKAGLKVTTTAPFTRKGELSGLPPAMVSGLFDTAPGGAVSTATEKAHFVGRLKQVIAADKITTKDLDAIAAELGAALQNDLLEQLTRGLRQRYPVTINSKALNELF
ncbi:MAG: SurA N-terminal domain-containing protein [Alphaproteobacteria bacterium]